MCIVNGCRYPNHHITRAHKCGNCGEIGHGQHECGNDELINNLHSSVLRSYGNLLMDVNHVEKMPPNMFCQNSKCRENHTHSTESHLIEFESPIDNIFKSVEKLAHKYLTGRKGYYYMAGVGQGYTMIYRNINGVIESTMINCLSTREIDAYTSGLILLI